MDIKRSGSQPSGKGPSEYFTGMVRIDPLFETPDPACAVGVSITLEPSAREAWHSHPLGQTLILRSVCLPSLSFWFVKKRRKNRCLQQERFIAFYPLFFTRLQGDRGHHYTRETRRMCLFRVYSGSLSCLSTHLSASS
jgi:Uncharacterized conserved protein, contains double-stranded beta-helix domain